MFLTKINPNTTKEVKHRELINRFPILIYSVTFMNMGEQHKSGLWSFGFLRGLLLWLLAVVLSYIVCEARKMTADATMIVAAAVN